LDETGATMTERGNADRRSKDVLFALAAAAPHDQPLGRLMLQKFVYLFDVLALAWREIGGSAAFRPWKNGPYDLAIQNAVDSLAFRGLATISNLSFRHARNTECTYQLTEAGSMAVRELCREAVLVDDYALFQEIAVEVNRRGWNHIKEIVYREPTFLSARSSRQGNALSLNQQDGNLSWQLLRDLRAGFDAIQDEPMSKRTLVQVFFALLDEYGSNPESRFKESEE
jgi:hypothetical protein